jgi:hypothetical protein
MESCNSLSEAIQEHIENFVQGHKIQIEKEN